MKNFISTTILYLWLIFTQIFFASLIAPFNTINILSIYLIVLFWAADFERAFVAALILGLMNDFVSRAPFFGLGGAELALALIVVVFLRATILTNENRISLFFLGIIFNVVYFGIEIARAFHFSVAVLEEALFAIIINAILAFAVYAIIHFFERQIRRRFM